MAQPNYRQLARRSAKRYGLDPNVFERQIQQESGFNPNAVSPAGALGIAQIMPATAKGWGVDPRNPQAALNAAARNMAQYVQKYGSYKNALVAYNAGPGRVGGPLPAETQNYVRNILGGSNPKGSTNPGRSTSGGTSPQSGTDTSRQQLALSLLGMGGGSDPLTSALGGVSSAYGVDPLQLAITAALQKHAAPASAPSYGNTPTPAGHLDKRTTYVDGKPVVGWIANVLKQAKAAGWKGHVTSGERTKAEQLNAARNFGLQHYPNGPLASNHVVGHDGAVDVSDPNGLKAVLRKLGVNSLKSSMADDPVHFSRSGH